VKGRTLIVASLSALIAVVGAMTVVVVGSGEVAVIYRFGAVQRTLGPGLNFRLPWPVESHDLVSVSEVRRFEPGKRRLLTGDTNLVELDLVVHYTITDAAAYQLGLAEPESVMSSIVLAASAEAVASMGVDALLTTGRTALQRGVEDQTQGALDALSAGTHVVAVEVRELAPPAPVVDAFNDVSSARGDRETLALAAESYASRRLPKIRGEAGAMVSQARAASAQRSADAAGDVARFDALLTEVKASPKSIRSRLWAQTAAAVGETVQVHVLGGQTEVFLGESP
jgi:membrane protease subunit HflK